MTYQEITNSRVKSQVGYSAVVTVRALRSELLLTQQIAKVVRAREQRKQAPLRAAMTSTASEVEGKTASAFSGLSLAGGASGQPDGDHGQGQAGPATFRDATKEIAAACEGLGLGGMVMNEGFTLQESMNALELMSPKMDTGMNADSYEDLEARMSKGEIRVPVASLQELDWVAKQLLIRELAWYEGHLLAASVYACAHICPKALEKLKPLAENIFSRWNASKPITKSESDKGAKNTTNKAKSENGAGSKENFVVEISEADSDESLIAAISYALYSSVVKSCGLVRQCIRRGDIYEEEDWSAQTFALPMGDMGDASMTLEMIEFGQSVLRAAQASGREAFAPEICQRIAKQFEFRSLYMRALDEMLQPNIVGWPAAEKLWEQIAGLVPEVGPGTIGEGEDTWKAAFNADIHRKLLASAPPRAGPTCDPEEAQHNFARLVADMRTACTLVNVETLFGMYEALREFSRHEPSIVVRSVVMLMVYSDNELALGRYSYETWIQDDMHAYGLPTYLRETEECKLYSKFAVKHIYDVLRLMLANRARQRRNIANLLPDWATMQQEAELYDHLAFVKANPHLPRLDAMTPEQIRENMYFYMGSWAAEWTKRIMLHHLLLGFELDLYNINEYSAIFFYAQDLMSRFLSDREETTKFNVSTLTRLARMAEDNSVPKKTQRILNARSVGLQKLIREQKTDMLHVKERLRIEIERLCMDGLLRYAIGLRKSGRFPDPELEFGSAKVRYNHRLMPYSYVAMPRFIPYENFEAVTNMEHYQTKQLLENASMFLTKAKELLGQALKTPNVTDAEKGYFKGLLKVVVSNSVNLMRATASADTPLPEGAKPKVEADFPAANASCYFPVVTSKDH